MSQQILHILSGDIWGGAEVQVYLQLLALREQGISVEVLLFNQGQVYEKFKAANLPCTVVEEHLGSLSLIRSALGFIKEKPPSLIVTHGYKETILGFILSSTSKIPFVSTFHGYSEKHSGIKQIKMALYLFLQRFLSRHAAKGIICVSQALATQLGYSALPKLSIIHNVVDLAGSLERQTNSVPSRLSLTRPAVVMIGRLVAIKRYDIAIRAFEELKDKATLYIVGEGPERARLTQLVSKLNLNNHVFFLGFQDTPRLILEQADLFLLTSDNEGIPTVLLEAIREGVPVVTRSLEGVSEVFEKIPNYPMIEVFSNRPEDFSYTISEGIQTLKKVPPQSPITTSFRSFADPSVAALQHIKLYNSLIH